MIEFLVDGEWCRAAYGVPQAALLSNDPTWWRHCAWQMLGLLVVNHSVHGHVSIVPRYYPWRELAA